MQHRGFYKTNIEKEMSNLLDNLGINYAPFFALRGYNIEMDFAIPDLKLDIECDGSFWHKKISDRKRDYFLKSKGWQTLRFSDQDILNNQDYVRNKIIEAIEWREKELKSK